MLIDGHQRRFHYLRMSITDVCNFKCNYCLPDGYQCESSRQFLDLQEIENLVTAFAELGVSKIRITGGEPALRKDLPQIIKQVKQTAGVEKVALTTNGFSLEKKIDEWVEAGLDQLNVSIDSLDPNNFRLITGSDKHESIMRGVKRAIELGVTTKINTVLLKQFNAAEFGTFIDWIKHTPVSLRFIELMQTGDNQEFFEAQHVRADEMQQQIERQNWLPIIKSKDAGPAIEYCHPEYAGRIGFIMPYSKDFCASCNRLRVSATGKLHQCLFAEHGNDLRMLLASAEQREDLKVFLREALGEKKVSHFLHDKATGATKHLAMLGG